MKQCYNVTHTSGISTIYGISTINGISTIYSLYATNC